MCFLVFTFIFYLTCHRISGKTKVSSQQAEYFLAQQAACIQCNESAALDPPELQAKITALLAGSPDIAEAVSKVLGINQDVGVC